jgi:hypothetical protein
MSTQPRKGVRKSLWSDKDLSGQSDDIRRIFQAVPDTEFKRFEGLYQKGIVLKTKGPPLAVECIRCRNPKVPTTPIAHGAAVSFDLKGDGVEITRIDGLIFGTLYLEMIFRITYGDV